jgi:hypothetical protein
MALPQEAPRTGVGSESKGTPKASDGTPAPMPSAGRPAKAGPVDLSEVGAREVI